MATRLLTEDEARKMIDDWRTSLHGAPIKNFYDVYLEAWREPHMHVVHYWRDGRIKYVPPNRLWLGPQGDSVLHIREPK